MSQPVAHEFYMQQALDLARLGSGHVSPNPMVGCLIVRDDIILSKGWHRAYGDVHAEVDALQLLQDKADGATMYVNLEPCVHYGKQPPCVEAIIASGIRHVVVAMPDPNPLVAGKGIEALRSAGIEVTTDILRDKAEHFNRAFVHWITTGRPHVTLKIATSIDGRVRMPPDQPRYLTSVESRMRVHRMRSGRDAVMIGVGTAIYDNPELTVRLCAGRNPVRVIIDPECRLPASAVLMETATEIRTLVVCANHADIDARMELADLGAEVVPLPADQARIIACSDILQSLAERGIASVLLEGGPYLASRMLREDAVDEIEVHTAPLIIGSGPEWFFDSPFKKWKVRYARRVGSDTHALYVRK
jgi:diaminohydroxyphosphoribosylaminopyrimidine deaminase/5-amino-6-(5-phosphoribosylamino)uracil reductase